MRTQGPQKSPACRLLCYFSFQTQLDIFWQLKVKIENINHTGTDFGPDVGVAEAAALVRFKYLF